MKNKKYYLIFLWINIFMVFLQALLTLTGAIFKINLDNLAIFSIVMIFAILHLITIAILFLEYLVNYSAKLIIAFLLAIFLFFSIEINVQGFFIVLLALFFVLLKMSFSFRKNPENFHSFFFRNKKTLIKRQELKKDDKSWLDYFRFTHKNDFLMAEKIFLKTPARTLVYLWTGFIVGVTLYFLFGENILYTSDVMSKFLTENYQSKEFRLIFNLIVLFFYLYAFFAFYMIFIELAKNFTYIPLIIFLVLAIFNMPYFALVFYITAFFQLAMTSLNSFADNDLDNYVYTVKTPESNRDNNDEDN